MVFYIHDQGARIATPVDNLLNPNKVSATDKISRVRPVGRKTQTVDQRSTAAPYTEKQQIDPPHVRKQLLYAQEIMSSPVQTSLPEQKLDNSWTLLAQRGFHHLPVVNQDNQLCGIVSDRDFLRFAANNIANWDIGNTQIKQLMTKVVISAAKHAQIRSIAEVMCQRAIGAVPIVDDNSTVVGIVTRSDILRSLINRAPVELWA